MRPTGRYIVVIVIGRGGRSDVINARSGNGGDEGLLMSRFRKPRNVVES